jgi:hypothetical protein
VEEQTDSVNVQALIAHLRRSPEEMAAYWLDSQRREYDRWWTLDDIISDLRFLGAEDGESGELVARAAAEQFRIHDEQADRAVIRDRLAGENE